MKPTGVKTALIVVLGIVLSVQASAKSRARDITVHFNYRGAEKLLDVLEKKTVSDAELSELLQVRGVRAMVTNTIKYFPANTIDGFRDAVREAAATGRQTKGDYQLDFVAKYQSQVRDLLAQLKAHESEMVADIVRDITRYQPNTGKLPITIYFVVGGVSDGFVLDNDSEPAFFVALDKAGGDFLGVKLNATHEAYHVAQKAAALKVAALRLFVNAPDKVPGAQRLLYTTLIEGTANFVADATKVSGSGEYIDMWRGRYERNLKPERLAANFASFDRVLEQLQNRTIAWEKAYATGFFGGANDAPFYFVGYEMARVLERYEGSRVIGQSFQKPPAEFFRRYIKLYHSHQEIPYRFSTQTEKLIATQP